MGGVEVAGAHLGKVNPIWKLPVTVVHCAGQLPMIYNYTRNSLLTSYPINRKGYREQCKGDGVYQHITMSRSIDFLT